jgi:hypothetical protein
VRQFTPRPVPFGLIIHKWVKALLQGLRSNSRDKRVLCILGLGGATVLGVAGMGSAIFATPLNVLILWIPISITLAVAKLPEKALS